MIRLCAFIIAATLVAPQPGARLAAQDTLHVLWRSPLATASPASAVTIMFDRPVAPSLDSSVRASRVFRIEPTVPGTVVWRDPATMRFVPSSPLEPGRRYTIRLDTSLRAPDGSQLAPSWAFDFRVSGPRLLERSFGVHLDTLPPDGRMQLLYSAPVDLGRIERNGRLELSKCPGEGTIALRARQRPLRVDDPPAFQYAGGFPRDSFADRFRTVVELEPVAPPPLECDAKVVIPTTDDESAVGKEERYALRTASVPRMLFFDCWPNCDGTRLTLRLSSPMRRADVLRFIRLDGGQVVIDGGDQLAKHWSFRVKLQPRTAYSIRLDSAARDTYGRPLEGSHELTANTGDFAERLIHPLGIITLPRNDAATFPLRSVNVRSVKVIAYRVPDSSRIAVMSMTAGVTDPNVIFHGLVAETTLVTLPDRLNVDTTTEIPLPPPALAPDHPMVAVRVIVAERLPDAYSDQAYQTGRLLKIYGPPRFVPWMSPYVLIQVTNLALTARLVGAADGAAFVTGLDDGAPRGGVTVTQFDEWGRVVGRGVSDALGIARLARTINDSAAPARTPITLARPLRFTSLEAQTGDDRVAVSFGGRAIGYRPGSPLTLSSLGARPDESPLAAGALFLDRDIFRPGEIVHVKGVVRRGMLGALTAPATTDSVRLVIRRERVSWAEDTMLTVRDTVIHPSVFGTIVDSVRLRAGLPLGDYDADLRIVVGQAWHSIQTSRFTIAEYRAPEFLVDLSPDTSTLFPGDTVNVAVHGHYLFGSPMRRVVVRWNTEVSTEAPSIPAPRGWFVGGWNVWVHGYPSEPGGRRGVDTLDANGRARIRIPAPSTTPGFASVVTIHAAVVDLTSQTVTAETTSAQIQSGRVFVLAHPGGDKPWSIGKRAELEVRAVDIGGAPVKGAVVNAIVVRHRLDRNTTESTGAAHWVVDTVRGAKLRPNGATASLAFTPDSAGEYAIELTASDSLGGLTRTSFRRVVGVIATEKPPALGYRVVLRTEQTSLEPGQTARIRYDSPFADAEAWITVEREGVIEQRRERARRGENVVSLPILARYAPNVWVSVVLTARGEKARPDTATQRLRAGYVELSVSANAHRLSVAVAPDRASYGPRDSTLIRVRVRDAAGRGVRSEVALWAVDEGVLSMTGMQPPDLIAQMYASRGVGGQLWSTLPTVLTTDPSLVATFLEQAAVMLSEMVYTGAGGRATVGFSVAKVDAGTASDAMRSHFSTNAFYLGAIRTDGSGAAIARAPVPDNLTTFRVFAVAVSAGDEYGTGDTAFVVTKPLVARAALPRFVRPADSLLAGVVVTARDGRPRTATTDASVTGATLRGVDRMSVSLSSTGSDRARFVIQIPRRDAIDDSVTVRFRATDGTMTDAVETRLPVRPDYHPRTHAVLGATRDSQTVTIALPGDIDPLRSRLRLRVGTSRLSAMLASYRWLRAYPYDCSEQLSSAGQGIVAVWQATKGERSDALGGDPRAKLQEIADEISRRQRGDGAIKYWPNWEWSSPWLTAYAGTFLLNARDLGASVAPSVITLATKYLREASRAPIDTGGMNRFEQRDRRLELGERVAAVEFLRRVGSPDSAAERGLISVVKAMTWEDRLRIAEVVASRPDLRAAADSILDTAWREVIIAGHRVDLPDSANGPREFPSRVAPSARLLSASLVLRPAHPLLAALVETVLQQGRAESAFAWNTQDYASLVMALAHFSEGGAPNRVVIARANDKRFVATPPATGVDTTISASLVGLLEPGPNRSRVLRLRVDASAGERPVYYALEVEEVPLAVPVTPDVQGIVVERSYERFDNGTAITRVSEGDLVRVRLRVTVPADRQFVALEDPLPAGLEPVDVDLRTSALAPFTPGAAAQSDHDAPTWQAVLYGSWEHGQWSPWEHTELHDDRVSYFARVLWTGTYTATYVARATTAGSFVAPPAYAEEMYNPALQGRTAGYRFLVQGRP